MIFLMAANATATASVSVGAIVHLLTVYKYYAIFLLSLLEFASLPILPSELVLPAIGYLAAQMQLNLYVGAAAAIVGGMIGIAIDYYVAYYIGKDVVYKHLKFFHIKQETLDVLDRWFEHNGAFAVFICRFIPVIKGLVSFPAGFAEMPKKKFFLMSFLGVFIGDGAFILFGYYALATSNLYYIIAAIAVFCIFLYALYAYSIRRIRNAGKPSRKLGKH